MGKDERIRQLEEENARLRAENEALRRLVGDLTRRNDDLARRIEELEREVHRQAAPFRRPERAKVPPERQKRPGRPVGHPGVCRATPGQIDAEVELPLPCCPQCGGPVSRVERQEQVIEEILPARPYVLKVTTYRGRCGRCGEVGTRHPWQTSWGQGAAKVQLGPRALALGAALSKQCGLTMRQTCRVLGSLTGLRVTAGGLSQALSRIAGRVSGRYEALANRIRGSPAVFADETSWWVGGPGWWLWTFTTPQETLYRVEHGRGSAVVEATLGPDFGGMLVSDCLSSYDPGPYRKHKCVAHHLRAISEAEKKPGMTDLSYLRQWKTLLKAVLALYGSREVVGPERFAAMREHLERQCDELLRRPVGQSGDVAVRNRLAKQRPHLLGCLWEPAAEPTNNRAERALRPAVIARKVSCGNKTERGRQTWQVLTSLAVTCQQRGENFVDYLAAQLPLAAGAG